MNKKTTASMILSLTPTIFVRILSIIILMVTSLAILGFNVLKIIDTMKITTNQMMAENNSLLENVANSRKKFSEIQTQYVLAMIGDSGMPTEYALQGAVDMLNILKSIDEEKVLLMANRLESLKKYLKIPPSDDGYRRFISVSLEYNTALDHIQRKISASSTAIVINNEQYSKRAKNIMLIILMISAFFSILLGLLIAVSLSKSLKMIGQSTKALATGDLSQTVEIRGCPEVRAVEIGLNNAIKELRKLVLEINKQAQDITETSNSLHSTSSQTKTSALQVATAMEDLAKSTNEQAKQANRTMDTVQELANLVSRVNQEIQNITNASDHVAQAAQLGYQSTETINKTFYDLHTSTQEATEVIADLSKASHEISETISLINNIAEQTTLLALNASIEAARAGEHGKSFAVVANKTRSLAKQSKEAVGFISDLIAQMNLRTENVVSVMQKEVNRIESGKELVFSASNNFQEIIRAVMNNITQISAVAKLATQMNEKNKDTTEAITSIAAITQENSACAEEISAASEEQSASMVQVAALADALNKISEKLSQSVANFRLEN